MRATIVIALLLSACGERAETEDNSAAKSKAPPKSQRAGPSKPAALRAKAFSVGEENELYTFGYSWSAESAAIPRLVKRFTKDMDKNKATLISEAKEDRVERAKNGFDYHPHEAQFSFETEGQSDRLLSLESSAYAFTGGAHGSSGSGALLWDGQLDREVKIQDLLQAGTSWTGAIRQPFCVLLDREREKRREEPVKKDDLFGNCPNYDEVTVVLSDADKNGRFDHLIVIADQYVAGPYAEGNYEISLPITAAMIDRLKPEYRASFEPTRPIK